MVAPSLTPEESYEALYTTAWADLAELHTDAQISPWLAPQATPVLTYGSWATAQVALAALNPSEDEFQTRGRPRLPLPPGQRRLLHWPDDGRLTSARLAEARRLAEGYFTLGQAYWTWFGRYRGLLAALGTPFESGLACQTNYGSPYATTVGWGEVPAAVRTRLGAQGGPRWRQLLALLPRLELIVGQGAGWRTVPALFGFTTADWTPIATPFDSKGGAAAGPRPHLLYRQVEIAGRRVGLAWWRPNRGGPLTWLSEAEGRQLGEIIGGLS